MAETAQQSERFNPISRENLLDPYPFYAALREQDPVHWSKTVHAWIITRHQDVMGCLRDSRLSANRVKFFEYQVQSAGGGLEIIQDLIHTFVRQMGMMDGPEHLRLRRQASPGFSPLVIDSWGPTIRKTMALLLDHVHSWGRMDLVQEISYQLPPLIIAEMLGIPTEDRERFQTWVKPIAQLASPVAGVDIVMLARQANTAMREICDFLLEIIDRRIKEPGGDDLLSRLIHRQEEDRMSREELAANAMLILSAGHVTTTDQISNAVHLLLTHPEQLARLQEDRSLLKSAVEEILRYSPAIPFVARSAVTTFELRGKTIKEGDVVFIGIGSANRDETVFPEPDRFDIQRDHFMQKHLSFAFGPHHCLGAGLARRELETSMEMLLDRLPGLRLDEEQPARLKCDNLILRGFESLPVRW